ncbi:E3 ubiquitin-protein ligase RSL1-like isoform X2 [Mercurialis annua]|uniref:E3 ubiquitin-protein ligase RSL1-like isoform X2 n=1 Tax=Mercurialis annua TaxID=3986 RepID=UPI002160587D|nr:E3 ubiquitin-protein ligase RSL1-like isoform X2 [Mercurialis annua]
MAAVSAEENTMKTKKNSPKTSKTIERRVSAKIPARRAEKRELLTKPDPFRKPHAPPCTKKVKRSKSQEAVIDYEKESSSDGQSSQIFCEICTERKEFSDMFASDRCVHNSFCSNCISKHISAKIQQSITRVTCPGINCRSVLKLDICRTKLSKRVIDRWEEALSVEMINQLQKIYCPFKDCSALLVKDNKEGEKVTRECECPFCHRLFCAECNVPWHSGFECGVFQKLNKDERGKDDLMLMKLAKQKKWIRCPKCRFYVERIHGCPHMTCRCRFEFCYGCGLQWNANHGGCARI